MGRSRAILVLVFTGCWAMGVASAQETPSRWRTGVQKPAPDPPTAVQIPIKLQGTPEMLAVNLTWTTALGSTGYQVWRRAIGSGYAWVNLTPTPVKSTKYRVSGLAPSIPFFYKVVSLQPGGPRASDSVKIKTNPAPAGGVYGVVEYASPDSVWHRLNWLPLEGALSYSISWRIAEGASSYVCPAGVVDDLTTTTFTRRATTCSTCGQCWYNVYAWFVINDYGGAGSNGTTSALLGSWTAL